MEEFSPPCYNLPARCYWFVTFFCLVSSPVEHVIQDNLTLWLWTLIKEGFVSFLL